MFSMGRLRNCVDEVLDKLTRNNESSIGEPLFQAGERLTIVSNVNPPKEQPPPETLRLQGPLGRQNAGKRVIWLDTPPTE